MNDKIWPFKDKSNSCSISFFSLPDGGKSSTIFSYC